MRQRRSRVAQTSKIFLHIELQEGQVTITVGKNEKRGDSKARMDGGTMKQAGHSSS